MKNKRELHFVCADCCISIPTIDADGELETLEEDSFMLHPHTLKKGENAGNQHSLLFPQYFQPFPKQISIFESL